MIRTRVGYAGGKKSNPAYHDLGDHSETVQVDFDPARISYQELLGIFWAEHNPHLVPRSRQYMSLIFYHDEGQRKLAIASRERQQSGMQPLIRTEVVPLSAFYLAEAYHQKYYLRGMPELMKEFRAIYPNEIDFINSRAAARVNGYVAGYGTSDDLEREMDGLGLSPASATLLLDIVRARHKEKAAV